MLTPALTDVVRKIYTDLDSPLSRKALLAMERGDWDVIRDLRASPADYSPEEADVFARDYQAAELLRKCRDLPGTSTEAREKAAWQSWLDSERRNAVTNHRFSTHIKGAGYRSWYDPVRKVVHSDAQVETILHSVKREFRKIMGPLPDFDQLAPRFGPGSVVGTVEGRVSALDKFDSWPSMTRRCAEWGLELFYRTSWGRELLRQGHAGLPWSYPQIVEGNEYFTVPKDSTTFRSCGKEPPINIFLQLAIGGYFKKRLKRVGLDLYHGHLTHAKIACASSSTGQFATEDQRNASNSLARKVVEYLCHPEWFDVLDSVRSPKTIKDGRTYVLQMFSSMGNGFTFELETMVFAAIAVVATRLSGFSGVLGKDVYVYGDDVIVPSEASWWWRTLLSYFGFETNFRKSYADGPFRESCGGDFFNERQVNPVRIEEEPADAAGWIALANNLRRVADLTWGNLDGSPLKRGWLSCTGAIPVVARACRGPTSLGDLVIHDHPDRWNVVRRPSGLWYIKVWRPVYERVDLRRYDPWAVLVYAGYAGRSRLSRRGEVSYRSGRYALTGYSAYTFTLARSDYERFSAVSGFVTAWLTRPGPTCRGQDHPRRVTLLGLSQSPRP